MVSRIDKFRDKRKEFFALTKENAVLSLERAYVAALAIIAILTVASHLLTAHIAGMQKESSQVAYYIGHERALVQQIILHAAQYTATNSDLDRTFLKQSIEEITADRAKLNDLIRSGGLFGGPMSKTLSALYYEQPFIIDIHLEKLIEMANTVVEYTDVDPEEVRQKMLDDMAHESSVFLVRSLDKALETYQAEALQKSVTYSHYQFYAGVLIIVTLMLEALYIFRPLVLRLASVHKMLLRQALEDQLTGLNNRRAFLRQGEIELKRAERNKSSVAVVICDLDHFKKVNDTHGHTTGDLVLQHFAGLMRSSLRTGDIGGRMGGEEFAIILPNTPPDVAQKTIERFVETVAGTPCKLPPSSAADKLSYTASFGMVTVSGTGWNIEQLLAQADINLYKAKNEGRNRAVASQLYNNNVHPLPATGA